MGRSDLHRAGSKFGINILVRNDRYFAIRQRQSDRLADKVFVTLVRSVDGDRCVAQHRFGSRRGNRDRSVLALYRVSKVIELAVFPAFLFYLEI